MHRLAARPLVRCIALLGLAACGGTEPGQGARDQPPPAALAARIRAVESGLVAAGAPPGSSPSSVGERMRHYRVPGVSIAVISDGRIDWARGYGVVEQGATQPVDTATLFQAASISKVVATVAALRLVEQGRLSLDEDVNGRLTAWRVPESGDTREQKVTLRRILTHTAGLTVSGFRGYERGQPVPTLLEVLEGAPPANSRAIGVAEVPGTAQRYSGGGFTVAQLLIGEAAGLPFETAVDGLVLRPGGMVHSTFRQPLPAPLESRAATGHDEDGSPLAGRWRTHPEQAAAGLWSTPSDLARFAIAIQRAAAGQGGGLLSAAMAGDMLTTQVGPSGLGFVVLGEGERRVFRHGGSNAGYRARMVAYVGGGRGAVVMTSGDAGMALVEEILESVARAYGWPAAG